MTARPTNEDPLVTNSRREALWVTAFWCLTVVCVLGYCYRYGMGADASLDRMAFTFGWPDWFFWGIVFPWVACTALSIVFAVWIMHDDPLENEPAARNADDAARHDAEPMP